VEAESFDELRELNAQGIGLQTERAIEGMWKVSYLFPLIGFGLAAIAFFFVRVKRRNVELCMKVNSEQMTREEAEQAMIQ